MSETNNHIAFPGAEILPRGDGSWTIVPGRPSIEYTTLQFAKAYGCSRSSVYRLINEGLLRFRRPTRRKILIPAAELTRLRSLSSDPEFWLSK